MTYLPINHYGLIGDLHTAALLGTEGQLVWLPWPRFDSPSLFAALLDDARGGDWIMAPVDATATRQTYEGETAILRTEWETPTGRADLHDWMTPWDGDAPSHDLYRVLRCTQGDVTIAGRFAPRLDYARAVAHLRRNEAGIQFEAHGVTLYLSSNHPWQIEGDTATLQVHLHAGEQLRCVFSSGRLINVEESEQKLEQTRRFRDTWMAHCSYDGLWADAVRRSVLMLRLLTYAPTNRSIGNWEGAR